MLLSPCPLSIPTLGLWLLYAPLSQARKSAALPVSDWSWEHSRDWRVRVQTRSTGVLSARQGDTAMVSCLVPLDAPMTCIVFCKDGKEISVQPKGGNTIVYDSPYTVSKESAGAFSCLSQLKDDNNQENNSLPSDPWDLHVDGLLAASQEICSSPGTLPAPRLFLDRLSSHQGDTAMLSCLVPCGIPVTRIIFCKDGKEISVQPKGGNTVVYDSPYTVSKESAGAFSCLYQLKDDNNQENNSLSSDPRYLHVDGGDGSGGYASPQGVALATLQNRYRHSLRVYTQSTPTEAVVLPVEETMSPNNMDPALRGMTPLEGRHVPKIKGLGPIVGLAIMAGLALAFLGCFLMKTVVSRCRTHREPGPDRSSPAAEDQIQSSAQPNDKVTGAVGRGQERDWLEPGSFCHKLQVCHPHDSHRLRFPANGSCRAGTWGRGSVRSPLAAPMHGSHGGTCRCFQMLHRARAVLTAATRVPFQPGVPSENQTPDNPIQHRQQSGYPDTVVTGARADQPRMDGDVAVTYAVVGKGRFQMRDTQTAPIPSAPQACMSPTLAASLIGAPGKEMVMEPVNQPARTSVWVNR
ncbi:unnamed protein product [Eretmochelys imbricata]